MSERWPGGIVRSTPVTPTGPLQNGTAPGMWTLDQANYWIKQGLWPIAGNFLAVEDVFSTYLYAGTSTADNKITNGIDLAGKGGMVWLKSRTGATSNYLTTNSTTTSSGGGTTWLYSDTTDALLGATGTGLCNFFSDGFDINPTGSGVNGTGNNYASWTFREAANFFDVVTYTGTGSARTIAHNLGIAPGMMIIKKTSSADAWYVWHRSLASNSDYMQLQSTGAANPGGSSLFNNTAPTASVFSVGTDPGTNGSGATYVAYLFAHDTSSTGLIQCGSFTTDGSGNATVNLGWEPQFIIGKSSSAADPWYIADIMRGMPVSDSTRTLRANSTLAEQGLSPPVYIPNATGFSVAGGLTASTTYIYIAIRRGPMRTPTLGTTVFAPVAVTPSTGTVRTIGFPADLSMAATRTIAFGPLVTDRLRGFVNDTSSFPPTLITPSTAAESTSNQPASYNFWNTTYQDGQSMSGYPAVYWNFRRAPSFFDEVCYTGTGSNLTLNHNLGAAPELMIVKRRDASSSWTIFAAPQGATKYGVFTTAAFATSASSWNNTSPTATQFTVGTSAQTNWAGAPHVAYLFASCPGVSKVGSYTGTGALQTINCGFTTGARFVLIKRTDSTGDWYVWDSARGISSGNDPYLLWNSSATEVGGTNYVDTDTTGFQVTAAAPAGINANGGSYIFLAIA